MKYLRRRREEKLYKQWSTHANLPPEAIPQSETPPPTKDDTPGLFDDNLFPE